MSNVANSKKIVESKDSLRAEIIKKLLSPSNHKKLVEKAAIEAARDQNLLVSKYHKAIQKSK